MPALSPWHVSLSVSPGCLLLCFLFRFSAALPRIPDYWVRYKLGSAEACQVHLAASLLWHFLCVKALLKPQKGQNVKVVTPVIIHFTAESTNNGVKHLVSDLFAWLGLCFRYSTIYTMFPVFSLVLDKDVKSEVAMLYPELYKDLLKVFKRCPKH